jgi:hypothetical protein
MANAAARASIHAVLAMPRTRRRAKQGAQEDERRKAEIAEVRPRRRRNRVQVQSTKVK